MVVHVLGSQCLNMFKYISPSVHEMQPVQHDLCVECIRAGIGGDARIYITSTTSHKVISFCTTIQGPKI